MTAQTAVFIALPVHLLRKEQDCIVAVKEEKAIHRSLWADKKPPFRRRWSLVAIVIAPTLTLAHRTLLLRLAPSNPPHPSTYPFSHDRITHHPNSQLVTFSLALALKPSPSADRSNYPDPPFPIGPTPPTTPHQTHLISHQTQARLAQYTRYPFQPF